MKITTKQYAQALYEAVADCSKKELPVALDNFIEMVKGNNHISKLDKIVTTFEELWNKKNGVVKARVSSSRPLSGESRLLVEEYLRRNFSAVSVELEEKVDDDLLGGIVVECGDRLIDASLRRSLDALKEEMIK